MSYYDCHKTRATPIDRAAYLYDAIYTREVVMARVGHFGLDQQTQIERVTRIVRARLDSDAMTKARPRIAQIVLMQREPQSRERSADFQFWVIFTDRPLVHQRLWKSVRQEIRRTVEGSGRHRRSSLSSYSFKIGAAYDCEFAPERLASGITLYRADDDDPLRSRPGGGRAREWRAALAAYKAAEAAWKPVNATFQSTERIYLARRCGLSDGDTQTLRRLIGYEQAINEDWHHQDASHHARVILMNMAAPDLAAVIRKLEIICQDNPDASAEHLILSDLRRLLSAGQGRA